MKAKLILLVLFVAVLTTKAQWEKISSLNIGVTGQTVVHNSHVFFYGSQQGAKLYRFDENGESFTDLSANIGDGFSFIGEFYGKLYGCWLSGIYTSEDNGETWNLLSSVNVTGNGAILRIVSDGDILYGVSNRKSIFKSTDEGNTWDEIIINDGSEAGLANLAVTGNNYVGVLLNVGAIVSKDGGQTWTVNNVSPSIAITSVYNFNGTIIGQSFNGIYIYNFDSDTWVASSAGLPSEGAFYITRSLTHYGGTIYLGGSQLIGSVSSVYTSSNNGASWNAVNMEGIGTMNGAGSVSFVAGNSKNIFCFYYGVFDSQNTGIYKTEYSNTTSVELVNELPAQFSLSQNYPNPFNPTTKINFSIPTNEFVTLNVYNTLGEKVAELVNQDLNAGSYVVDFNASKLSSGIYFYSLNGKGFSLTKKLTLMK